MLEFLREAGFRPRRCTWEITLACNLRCRHCGSRAGQARADELTTSEAFAVIDDLATLGCEHVTLAGGEPTLRADWPQLVERLTERGVKTSVLSNGMTWGDEQIAAGKAAGLHQVGFSLDGLAATHELVRRAPGCFGKVLAAIDRSREAQLAVIVVTHVTKRSLPELEALHAVLGDHGVAGWQVQLGVPQGNLADEHEVVLAPEAVLELIPRLAALIDSGRPPRVVAADNIGYYGPHAATLRPTEGRIGFWLGCRAGLQVVGLESNGNVKGCLSLPSELNGRTDFVEGNVRDRSLIDIWSDPDAFAYNRRFEVSALAGGPCEGCDWAEVCRGGCTFTSVGTHGVPHRFTPCFHRLSTRD